MAGWNEKEIHCAVWINHPEVDVIFQTHSDVRRFHMADKWNDWKYGINLFKGDSVTPTNTSTDPWSNTQMKVSGGTAEKFEFHVVRNGKTLVSRWQDINAYTGNLGDGDMGKEPGDQKITVVHGLIVQYTFYDAGNYGSVDLPRAHQCYVTVAPDRSQWMTAVMPPGSANAQTPFHRFVLPAPHNFGFNSMDSCEILTTKLGPAAFVTEFLTPLLGPLGFVGHLGPIGAANALRIMEATSRNQKDSVPDQLAMGARFFEVRASRIDPRLRAIAGLDDLYFHHGVLPGLPIRSFLQDAVDFLCAQPNEIIVVWFTWNNWSSDHPEPDTVLKMLQGCFDHAKSKGVTLERGTFADISRPVEALRQENKRFIMSFKDEGYAPYDDYKTARHIIADGSGIVTEFNNMTADKQNGTDMTYLQCQTTMSSNGVALGAAITFHNRVLLAQKANTDNVTLGWLYANAKARFGDDHLLVILNDFFDLATSDVADQLTKMRLWDP
ncbi:PLC-like phosphodiesterase [Aspergillus californicus]